MKYFIDTNGSYLGGWDDCHPAGAIEVPFPPNDARQLWVDGEWVHALMTESEMRASEIKQDKLYLADTDWIVAKIGEASLTRQDTAPLLDQYSSQLAERERARIRIRINEGRA